MSIDYSSDIWVAGSVPNSTDTQVGSGVSYAVGSVTGRIKTAEVDFAGYTIPDQAFLEVTPDNLNKEGDGILGLGPNDGSNIYKAIPNVTGAALLDRIFLLHHATPNYLTVLLGRSEDPTDFYGGSLTVGQVIEGFENVLNQPKLPVVNSIATDQHFQILLDEDGLIADGRSIAIHTEVASTPNDEQVTVVLDTGFSLPQVPSSVAAEIYGSFVGAQLEEIESLGKIWLLPCSQEVNITFKFQGKPYPIHPLDATL
ncbi:hypothetical protein H0H87_006174 [Tephrocybe sp. NHM501043]|nr:hypothetical protein H0H87_006174 [Tephrocybe sp. NHM501043]